MDEHFLSIIVVYSDQSPIVHKVQMFEKYFTSWCTAYKWVRTSLIRITPILSSVWQRCIIHKKNLQSEKQCFMISLKILIFDVLHITYVSIVFFFRQTQRKKVSWWLISRSYFQMMVHLHNNLFYCTISFEKKQQLCSLLNLMYKYHNNLKIRHA